MKKTTYLFFLFCALALLSFGSVLVSGKKPASFHLISRESSFRAGEPVALRFSASPDSEIPMLFIIHSYGKTILEPKKEKDKFVFIFPESYSTKTGTISWFLTTENKTLIQGNVEILPSNKSQVYIENYLGPRSILAGGKEFTMMVTVPSDGFDNPLADNTPVLIKHQFLDNISVTTEKTMNFIAWKDIFSENKSGKLLVSSDCSQTATKEIETEIYPNIATDFTINYARNHAFADGNQITKFTTSIIKDAYGNTVSDGTMVTFNITNANQKNLKTFGTTIGGIATAQLLHPDHQDDYIVKAYVTGIATSNRLRIHYNPLIASFNYDFTNQNRTLQVGPLRSFMGQLVPDGIQVKVVVYHGQKAVATLYEESNKGYASFVLPADIYKEKTYRFKITTLGVTQTTETKEYVIN
ncbi:hypothetical protein [Flavobacterium sp.]|uniref:hypothetical protein n=1 Tax=Flavobacterium sp. TaxID=239 RepID=UPI002626D0E0|nr:hypothetical protein [Flavobacterium sp.]